MLLVHCAHGIICQDTPVISHSRRRKMHSMGKACAASGCCCRADAPAVFRRYWEYAYPIREFMAGTSKEAIQVTHHQNCLFSRRGMPQDRSLDAHTDYSTHCFADVASVLCSRELQAHSPSAYHAKAA